MSKKIIKSGTIVLFKDRVGTTVIGEIAGYWNRPTKKKVVYIMYTFGTSMEEDVKAKDIIRVITIKELEDE